MVEGQPVGLHGLLVRLDGQGEGDVVQVLGVLLEIRAEPLHVRTATVGVPGVGIPRRFAAAWGGRVVAVAAPTEDEQLRDVGECELALQQAGHELEPAFLGVTTGRLCSILARGLFFSASESSVLNSLEFRLTSFPKNVAPPHP